MLSEAGLGEASNSLQSSHYNPGSLLSTEELARMWRISCEELTVVSRCPPPSSFRSIDGTCNNLRNPTFGARGTVFPRFLPALYENSVDAPRGRRQSQVGNPFTPPNPSARYASQNLLPDKKMFEPSFTDLIWQWGQFIDHDITLSPETEVECEDCKFTGSCEPIRVAKWDPAFGIKTQNRGNCMRFRRSLPACPVKQSPVREQINDLTSFIDGSMVYGSTERVARALRQFRGGLLKVGPPFPGKQSSLPRITPETRNLVICMERTDCFLGGDIRLNEQTGLLIMHTIWVREHNRCARNIARLNKMSNDEQIYQLCRKIVGAIIQKITYQDWLPKLFGITGFRKYVGPYRGYKPSTNPGVPNAFATASYRFGHSMVPPSFNRLNRYLRPLPIGPLPLANVFFNPNQYTKSLGTDPILRGMLQARSRRLDRFIERTLTTRLFRTKNNPGFDLAALNIQRGRDHGLPPFIKYAKFCYNIFKEPPKAYRADLQRLLKIYGSILTVDLFVGGLFEKRVRGSIFGPTFACLNGLGFRAMRDGDRLYYSAPGVFTSSQLPSIQRHTLSRVLCDNMDNLGVVQRDAFLVSGKRVSCSSIPRFDYTPFRMDKLAEKAESMESEDNDLDSEYKNLESEKEEVESEHKDLEFENEEMESINGFHSEHIKSEQDWVEDILEDQESSDVEDQESEDDMSDNYVPIIKMKDLNQKSLIMEDLDQLENFINPNSMNNMDENEAQRYNGCVGK